jgi:site-specific recombinase XerD
LDNLPVPWSPAGELVDVDDEALDALRDAADGFVLAETAPATRRAYESDFRDFKGWCDGHRLCCLPAEIETVALYLTQCAHKGLKVSTIDRRAAAIAFAHRRVGREPPTNAEVVKSLMRGLRRTIGASVKQKAPAVADTLREMLGHVPETLIGIRDRALLLLGFAIAQRRSNIVALDVPDLDRAREGLRVHIRRSKTDQEGRGQTIAVPNGSKLKPVRAVDDWLTAAGITEGAVFRSIRKGGRVGERLSDRSVANIVKHYAGLAGYDVDDFAGHSLRAGFATEALANGADMLRVMDVTLHRDIRTLKLYDRRAREFRNHAGAGIL